ncbi:hypothetical protein ATANTOWER_025836 [Ataeniobius toweri]|uniref:Uncharacterized protein n=1 Tax=Ataeniobius toweri TaxID=208326 RepID=A0ABU7B2C8_9TELE|nr:hypothetical protein [Ataeniobius toweri]
MRGVYPNDHVGGVSGCKRFSPQKVKVEKAAYLQKENPVPSELSSIKERKSEALNTPPRIIIISPEHTPDKLPTAAERENLMDNVSPKEELEIAYNRARKTDLIKPIKANNERAINNGQPLESSAVERQDSSKDETLKLTPRRSLFKDQDNVLHKRISSVQQEAKSGPIKHTPRVSSK